MYICACLCVFYIQVKSLYLPLPRLMIRARGALWIQPRDADEANGKRAKFYMLQDSQGAQIFIYICKHTERKIGR